MFDINKSHPSFEDHDDNNVLTSSWTMDKIKRNDGTVWVMNHFFINPNSNLEAALAKEMPTALSVAQESDYPIWPLDPIVIDYFEKHPEFHKIWYHRPYAK